MRKKLPEVKLYSSFRWLNILTTTRRPAHDVTSVTSCIGLNLEIFFFWPTQSENRARAAISLRDHYRSIRQVMAEERESTQSEGKNGSCSRDDPCAQWSPSYSQSFFFVVISICHHGHPVHTKTETWFLLRNAPTPRFILTWGYMKPRGLEFRSYRYRQKRDDLRQCLSRKQVSNNNVIQIFSLYPTPSSSSFSLKNKYKKKLKTFTSPLLSYSTADHRYLPYRNFIGEQIQV